jgi:trehalose 6-phosphate synthase
MIISEFAGAAQSLNGSIVMNPWDSQQVADAIHEAVVMPVEVRAENHRKLFRYVDKYSAAYWGSSFIREMGRIAGYGRQATAKVKTNGEAKTSVTKPANGTVPEAIPKTVEVK